MRPWETDPALKARALRALRGWGPFDARVAMCEGGAQDKRSEERVIKHLIERWLWSPGNALPPGTPGAYYDASHCAACGKPLNLARREGLKGCNFGSGPQSVFLHWQCGSDWSAKQQRRALEAIIQEVEKKRERQDDDRDSDRGRNPRRSTGAVHRQDRAA